MAKRVIIGVGADKPGLEKFSLDCGEKDAETLAGELRTDWQTWTKSVEDSEDDDAFVWLTVTDDQGNWDFDLEDELTELLDD